MARALFVVVSALLLLACSSAPAVRARAPSADPLAHTTLEALDREACPHLLARTFPLDDGKATNGDLWVRECTTHVNGDALDVQIAVLGWQWIGEGSWGFTVREYVYFRASVQARLHARVVVEGDEPKVRVWSEEEPRVEVREIGRVGARASTLSASLLGFVSRIAGEGPNVLATSALRSRVDDAIRTSSKRGVLVALSDASPPGGDRAQPHSALDEAQELQPSGALISGSFPAGIPMVLRFRVEGSGAALARAVCDEDAAAFVDAIVANGAPVHAGTPSDVLTLRGTGEQRIPAQPCRWVLVTGPESESTVALHVALHPVGRAERTATRRWVKATIRAYAVEGTDGKSLLALRFVHRGERRAVGRPLTSARAEALSLVVGPFELTDGEPLDIAFVQLSPRQPHWWSGVTYDETPIGDALIVPTPGTLHEEKRVTIATTSRAAGWVDIALDAMEAP